MLLVLKDQQYFPIKASSVLTPPGTSQLYLKVSFLLIFIFV